MKSVGTSANGSGAGSTDLRTHLNAKKKYKPKMPINSSMVDLSASPLSLKDIGIAIAEKISYTELDNLANDENMNKTTPKKTHTYMYVLDCPSKALLYSNISDDNEILKLSFFKFAEFNQLLLVELHVLEKWSFNLAKSFALDIKVSMVSDKTIIKSSFISEMSLKKTKKLAVSKKILVNDIIKQINIHTNWEIVVKEISVDLFKSVALVEFKLSDVTSSVVFKWSVFIEKNSVHMALVKTCVIGHNLNSYVHDKCAIVCFKNEASKLAAIGSTPVFKNNCVCLVNIYKKKQASIACLVSFSDKTWAQIASGFFFIPGLSSSVKLIPMVSNPFSDSCLVDYLAFLKCSLELLADQIFVIMKKLSIVELGPLTTKFCVSSLVTPAFLASNLDLDMALDNMLTFPAASLLVIVDTVADFSSSSSKVLTTKMGKLESKLVALEVSLKLVLKKLNCLCSDLGSLSINVPAKQNNIVHWHMELENMIKNKFDDVQVFTTGLDASFLDTRVAIIMNNFLAHYVSTVEEVSGWLIFVCLLFKNKLLVSVLGFYAGVSIGTCFG
ncbi:hypothetical protein G9A89_007315 [Geosiphon pyriformis]|nr:hypothetical protein G9A89_007315 [Geosiphon pyriformis]